MKFKTISSRIFTFVIPTIIITIISFAALSYYISDARINQTIDEKIHESLQAADLDIQFELYKNAVVAEHLARYGKTMKIDAFDHAFHESILEEYITSNPNTFGGGVWFEPYAFDSNSYYFGPFLYVDDSGETHYAHEYANYADYFNEEWYLSGKSSDGETVWSKVYYDPFSTMTMVTASSPFYDAEGRFLGMGTADMNIEDIRKIVSSISVGDTGQAFIIGADGEYISFEGKNVGDTIQTDADEALAQLGKEIQANDSGVAVYSKDGKKFRAYYMTMENVNWTLAVTIDESEIKSSAFDSFIIMTVIPVLGLALIISGIFVIVNYLRRIINKVNNFADVAASGDFSKQIDVTETDEFGLMEQRLNKMITNMNHKDRLLYTMNTVAGILLQSDMEDFENDLWRCMEMMAESVEADRMYIWKNHVVDGELYCTQLYEWSEGAEPQQGKEITIDTPYSEAAPSWEHILAAGQSINNMVSKMSPEEQSSLSPQGIISILVVPVFLREEFWGFVGFDDCRRERVFSADEESVLRSGSLLIAYALLRNQMTLDIHAAVETAQSASLAKSNFLSNMSHEMRTPMNAIIGMTSIGKSAADVKKKDYALGKIEDASNHLLGVINDILDISKIEANKFELSAIEFNFEKMLQKVVNVICFRVDEKKQYFTVFLDKNIPRTMIGDDQRLSQVIANLLSNAVKFTPEQGSIRLDTRFINEENGVCTIKIEVTDTGIGISPEHYPRLFESFEQAERSTSRQYGGTGLGLAISKHIVDLMDGSIWVESEPDKGSKFAFTVKLGRGTEEPVYPVVYGINRKNVKVLAVDDEPETREYFASIAEQLGITCDTAAGGEDALRLINSRGSYNMYFVDWNMPGMNGIELSREIKARESDRSVVIMISAVGWSVIESDAKTAGVDKFLPKPLFPSSIADCISEYVGLESIREAKKQSDEIRLFKGYRLLMAEDVEINREIVKTILEPAQLEIDCASNGIEAVQMFSDAPERYDIIFMDMQMPDMDGLEATRRIRSLGFAKAVEIPIIAMTANVFREDVEKCLKAGMNDHIGKPLDFDDLFNKLYKYLKPNGLNITSAPDESTNPDTSDLAARPPVIDAADGIRRFMNKKELYLNTLVRFNGRQMADELINNMKSSDFTGIIKAAHTLKGVAANLALIELRELAYDIEAKAKAGMECVDMVDALDEAVNAVNQSIRMLVEGEGSK